MCCSSEETLTDLRFGWCCVKAGEWLTNKEIISTIHQVNKI